MKTFKYLLVFLFIGSSLNAQNIVTNALVSQGIVSLGGDAKVTFNVKKITLCDSYTIEWDINYIAKIINIKLNYNYFSNCMASNLTSFETISKPLLLEGIYWVTLSVNVPNSSSLNQSINLLAIHVNKPFQINCTNSIIPFFSDLCPVILKEVCACNGKTYQNECKAYLMDRNGRYESDNCFNYTNRVMWPFQCKTYNALETNSNLFAKYSCSNDVFEGNELILRYIHNQTSNYKLQYQTLSNTARVFLTKIGSNNNIDCIAITNNGLLEVPMLAAGTYFIIVENLNQAITFCSTTSTDELSDFNTKIYPNPTTDLVVVKSDLYKIHSISLIDNLGKNYLIQNIDDYEVELHLSSLPQGVYYLKIQYVKGIVVTKKIFVL